MHFTPTIEWTKGETWAPRSEAEREEAISLTKRPLVASAYLGDCIVGSFSVGPFCSCLQLSIAEPNAGFSVLEEQLQPLQFFDVFGLHLLIK